MAVDVSAVSKVDAEPGELPETMAAWVIRQEREGEPTDAFQLEEIEIPEPGAFEVIVRVMAAGVNFNNVWAALGEPVSVFRLPPRGRPPHRRLRRIRRRVEGRRGRDALEARRRGRHPLQPGLLRGPRGPRPRSAGRALAEDLGLRDQLGLLRPVHQGPGAAAAAQAEEPDLGGVGLLRPDLLHRLPDAHRPVQAPGRPPRPHLGRRRRPGRVRHAAVRDGGRRGGRRRVLRREGRAGQAARRRRLHRPQRVRGHDAQGRRVARGGEGALQGVAALRQAREGHPRRRRPTSSSSTSGRPTFPTSVLTVKPFGKVVICAAPTGYNLDFDVRYLWMRQKQIIGSHFANAWEANKANELIEQGQIRPVLWRTMGFDGVAEAHQLMRENKHLGKIAILVGAAKEGQGKTAEGPGAIHAEVGDLMAGPTAPASSTSPGTRRASAPTASRRRCRDRAGGAALRRDRVRGPPLARRPLHVHAVLRLRRASWTGSATGTGPRWSSSARTTRAGTRSR